MTGSRVWTAVGALLAFGVPLALSFRLGDAGIDALSLWAVTTIAAIGLNLAVGYVGQVSLAQGAFVGIGAYASLFAGAQGWSFPASIAAAGLSCLAIAGVLGWAALRLHRHYLPFATLAFAVLATLAFRNGAWLIGDASAIARPASGAREYFQVCFCVLVLAALLAWWILRSPWGRAFRALRDSPGRAESLGVNIAFYSTAAFAIGAGLGGVAGALLGPLAGHIDPGRFDVGYSVELLLIMVVGGSGRFFGPFLGALLAILLPAWLGVVGAESAIVYAVLAVAVLAVWPTGAMGAIARLRPAAPEETAP